MGYTSNLQLTGLTFSTYSANSQNICGPTDTGRNITVSVGGSYIVTWNYYVYPSNPTTCSSIYISTNEGLTYVDSPTTGVYNQIGQTDIKTGTLTRLYCGPACTFSPICFLGNGSSMIFSSTFNSLNVMRIA